MQTHRSSAEKTASDIRKPLLITFSGVDGSGKSTHIASVLNYLASAKMRTVRLAFWDDAVVGKHWREEFVHKVYKSEKGVGALGKPVARNDKNVRAWYLSLARHGLYLVDAIHLCEVIARARRGNPDVIIVDRYIYDELANLPLDNQLTRIFARCMGKFVPKPDLALLLDAEPEAARNRKPEYPIEFMKSSRQAYFQLARLLGRLTTIAPLPLEAAKQVVLANVCCLLVRKKCFAASIEPVGDLTAA